MAMQVTRVDATLGAIVTGVSLAALTDREWSEIERAFHDNAVLVFPGQHLTADDQIAFAKRFGELEVLVAGYEALPLSTVTQSGEVMDPDHPIMQNLRGNQEWHTDSSYMPVSSKASVLSTKVVTATGGETEWADMRAAYDDLDDDTRKQVSSLSAFHSIAFSQAKAGFTSKTGYGMDEPAQLRPLVKVHPVTGRPALYIGRHAHAIPGLPRAESDALLADLLACACRPPARISTSLGTGRRRGVGQPVRSPPRLRVGSQRAARDAPQHAHCRRDAATESALSGN